MYWPRVHSIGKWRSLCKQEMASPHGQYIALQDINVLLIALLIVPKDDFAGADPEFPDGLGTNSPWGTIMILPNFLKNCMKFRKFWALGVRPLDPPMFPDKCNDCQ